MTLIRLILITLALNLASSKIYCFQDRSGALLRGHKSCISSLAFSPDGSQLASGEMESSNVLIWSVQKKKVVQMLEGLPPQISPKEKLRFPYYPGYLAFSASGKKLVASGHSFYAAWDCEKSRMLCSRKLSGDLDLTSLTVHPIRESMVAGVNSHLIDMLITDGSESAKSMMLNGEYATSISFAVSGKRLFVWKGTVVRKGARNNFKHSGVCYEFPTMKKSVEFSVPDVAPPNLSLFFDKDQFVATGSYDGAILIWDAATGKVIQRQSPDQSAITGLCYNENRKLLVASTATGTIWFYDPLAKQVLKSLEFKEINALALSANGQFLAVGYGDPNWRTSDDPVNNGALDLFDFDRLLK